MSRLIVFVIHNISHIFFRIVETRYHSAHKQRVAGYSNSIVLFGIGIEDGCVRAGGL